MSELATTGSGSNLCDLIGSLRLLLTEETEALRHLDHAALDEITSRKQELLLQIEAAPGNQGDDTMIREMREIRQQALMNQVLMVHARDLTQGLINSLTLPPNQTSTGSPRLLHVRV